MMRTAAILLSVGFVFAVELTGLQASDPYVSDITAAHRQRAEEAFTNYLNGVRSLYFATGCNVFGGERLAEYPIQNNLLRFVNQVAPAEEVVRQIRVARSEGLAKAKGGCVTWQNDPDATTNIRRRAEAGIMP
jgi:hypothetical protein